MAFMNLMCKAKFYGLHELNIQSFHCLHELIVQNFHGLHGDRGNKEG